MKTKTRFPTFLPFVLIAYVVLLAGTLGMASRAAANGRLLAAPPERTAADVLEASRVLFSKSIHQCETRPVAASDEAARTVGELWLEYVCERGPEKRVFAGDSPLTRELAATDAIHAIRQEFYRRDEPRLEGTYIFNVGEFVSATGDMIAKAKQATQGEFSITHFLGSFEYVVTSDGERVTFVVHNVTDRASGTRVPLRFPDARYTTSLERLLEQQPELAQLPFIVLVADPAYPVLSILEGKTRHETDDALDEGGGSFENVFEWSENYLPQETKRPLATYYAQLDIR